MIGEKEVIDHLSNGQELDGIIIMVGSNKQFNPKEQNFVRNSENLFPGEVFNKSYCGTATIFTGKTRPKVKSIPFLKNQKVQLVDGGGTDALFASWYSIIVDSDPAYLVALDSEGEIYVS